MSSKPLNATSGSPKAWQGRAPPPRKGGGGTGCATTTKGGPLPHAAYLLRAAIALKGPTIATNFNYAKVSLRDAASCPRRSTKSQGASRYAGVVAWRGSDMAPTHRRCGK